MLQSSIPEPRLDPPLAQISDPCYAGCAPTRGRLLEGARTTFMTLEHAPAITNTANAASPADVFFSVLHCKVSQPYRWKECSNVTLSNLNPGHAWKPLIPVWKLKPSLPCRFLFLAMHLERCPAATMQASEASI